MRAVGSVVVSTCGQVMTLCENRLKPSLCESLLPCTEHLVPRLDSKGVALKGILSVASPVMANYNGKLQWGSEVISILGKLIP